MFDMKFLPPGRGLWAMGTEYVEKRGSMALNNCAFVSTKNLTESVTWTMDALMCGCGVGFNIAWKGDLRIPRKSDEIYVIPDSREGWVQSVAIILDAYQNYNELPKFDYSIIRPKGSKISGFGGTASGPDPLIKLHKRLNAYLNCYINVNNAISTMTANEATIKMVQELVDVEDNYNDGLIENIKLIPNKTYGRTRLIVDIFNAIGACVVAGNVRRSSEIALADANDDEFIHLKDFKINPERSNVMWMSNNTIQLKTTEEFKNNIPEIANKLKNNKNGEPGIYNMLNVNCQQF